MYDAAYLLDRYKTEFRMLEIPAFVQGLIFPVALFFGNLMGKKKPGGSSDSTCCAASIYVISTLVILMGFSRPGGRKNITHLHTALNVRL